jgi:hypothetical protein
MAAKLKAKRTSITTMGAKIQAFDIFQTPLSSHYPLPLSQVREFFKGFPTPLKGKLGKKSTKGLVY